MPIPVFDINGVLPPYLGSEPGQSSALMSPYDTTATEVVQRFSYSPRRVEILTGWLAHRQALRDLGFLIGFQFIDGSFVEYKEPNDIDVVTYSADLSAQNPADVHAKMVANPTVFSKKPTKAAYFVDAQFVDLRGNLDNVIRATSFWIGLFSHNRPDALWKGMLRVPLDDVADDATAMQLLAPTAPATT